MAKNFTPAFQTHINQEVLTLCTCWLTTLRSGRQLGFTDLDRDIVIEGVTYKSRLGFDRTASRATTDAQVQNFDLSSILDIEGINPGDLLAGDFDGAKIQFFYINYLNPPASLTAQPLQYCPLSIGTLGQITTDGQAFTAQFRGWLDRFNRASTWLTSRTCRYQLGDSKCRVNLAQFTLDGATIVQIIDTRNFFLSNVAPAIADIYAEGQLIFLSGANIDNIYQIKGYTAGRLLTLYEPIRRPVLAGTQIRLIQGCDKTIRTCYSKFNNIKNFGGEPHIPGWDALAAGKGTNQPAVPPAPPAGVNPPPD